MKKFFISILWVFISGLFLNNLNAQGAKRYVLFEHFTNASCPPCAAQNPVFEAFYEQHLGDARHLEIHTSWPGFDPMYNAIPALNDAMVAWYGVQGVPDMEVNGVNIGGPAAANESHLVASTSPIRIKVKEEDTGTNTRHVTVTVESVQAVTAGDYFLRVATVEHHIVYGTAPGNNGEKEFADVLRGWAANEVPYIPAAVGQSVTFEYDYTLDATWNADEIYSLAYIVNSNTKEVLNTGTTYDIPLENSGDSNFAAGAAPSGNNFTATLNNISSDAQNVEVVLTKEHPSDWDASFEINGNTYASTATLSLGTGNTAIKLKVNAGTTKEIGRYTITVTPVGATLSVQYRFMVVNGITDLVVARTYDGLDLTAPYTGGLALAGNNAYSHASEAEYALANSNNAFADLNNIYLSIGWTFPALTDELVAELEAHLDGGGNLLIAGQDIGWDVMSNDPNAHTSPAQQAFYQNYLKANFVNDGSASQNSFTAVSTDPVFGGAAGGSIVSYPGGAYLYPDQIEPVGNEATSILLYNNNKSGGIRVQTSDYKLVYLGVGLEQVPANVANEWTKISHDWFYGALNSHDLNLLEGVSLGQSNPNPARHTVTIPVLGDLPQASILQVTDLSGRVVYTTKVGAMASQIQIDTDQMGQGMYFYQLINQDGRTAPKKMTVVH